MTFSRLTSIVPALWATTVNSFTMQSPCQMQHSLASTISDEPSLDDGSNIVDSLVPEDGLMQGKGRHFDCVRFEPPYPLFEHEIEENDPDFDLEEFEEALKSSNYDFERGSIVRGMCTEYAKGGCYVDIYGKSEAFMYTNEAALYQPDGSELSDLVELGKEMDFLIISRENKEGRQLVSRRRIEYRAAWDKLLEYNENDEIVEGEVVAVNRGGAVMLLNGLHAFLPGSHLPARLASDDLIGQKLPVKFLEVDPEKSRLLVSNRKAIADKAMSEMDRGDLVTGMIKAVMPYGAFVEVGDMSGLLHISQISYGHVSDIGKLLHKGMEIKCMIIEYNKALGRIALSTKVLEDKEGDMLIDPQKVFDNAEVVAQKRKEKMEVERLVQEEANAGKSTQASRVNTGQGPDKEMEEKKSSEALLAEMTNNLDSLLS